MTRPIINGRLRCSQCEAWKSAEEFAIKNTDGRRHSWCKPCTNKLFREKYSPALQARRRAAKEQRHSSMEGLKAALAAILQSTSDPKAKRIAKEALA